MNEFDEILRSPVNRRAFLTRMSAAGLGAAAVALLAGCGSGRNVAEPGTVPGILDPNNFPGIPGRNINEVVLNYALALEILEADLYRQALNRATGRALTTPLASTASSYTQSVGNGSLSGPLAAAGFLYLVQYAYVEAAHRDFLRTTIQSLGGQPISANVRGYQFAAPLGSDLASILQAILPLEETGVRAYLGAAGFMTDFNLLTTAVAIHSTEARHSAAISYVLGVDPGPNYQPGDKRVTDGATAPNPAPYSENTFQYYLDPPTVLTAIRPLIVT